MLFFQKLAGETQMPKPQEYTYLHFGQKVVFSWPPRSSKYVKSGQRPCKSTENIM